MSPRLIKVLASGKEFLIVTETEPYYLVVYSLIRDQERKQGTWSWEDEDAYVEAIMDEKKRLITDVELSDGISKKQIRKNDAPQT